MVLLSFVFDNLCITVDFTESRQERPNKFLMSSKQFSFFFSNQIGIYMLIVISSADSKGG